MPKIIESTLNYTIQDIITQQFKELRNYYRGEGRVNTKHHILHTLNWLIDTGIPSLCSFLMVLELIAWKKIIQVSISWYIFCFFSRRGMWRTPSCLWSRSCQEFSWFSLGFWSINSTSSTNKLKSLLRWTIPSPDPSHHSGILRNVKRTLGKE